MTEINPVEQKPECGLPAGFVTRLIAFLVDLLIVTAVGATLTLVAQFIGRSFGMSPRMLRLLAELTALASFLFMTGYAILLTVMGGQTIGKRIMGVRVVRLDGAQVELWPAARRFIGCILSIPFFWGYLMVLVDNRRQAFQDKLAGTIVIYYTVPQGELGAFERYLKAVQVRRQAELDKARAARHGKAAEATTEGQPPAGLSVSSDSGETLSRGGVQDA